MNPKNNIFLDRLKKNSKIKAMRKEILRVTIFSFLFAAVCVCVNADDGSQALQLAASSNPSTQAPSEDNSGTPEWVKRTKIGIEAGTDIEPAYFLESVQPLFGTGKNETVFFNHARIAGRDHRTTYNLGVGARHIFNDAYLLGANMFYDFQDFHQHHRAGVGFEAFTDNGLEARVNTYFRVSTIRTVNDQAGVQEFEKVANGLDWEFGSPIPYLPFLKIYGGAYWYNFEKFRDKVGWNTRLEYNPIKNSRLVFRVFEDNKMSREEYRLEGAMTLAFTSFHPKDILKDLKLSSEFFPKIDLKDKVLERVVRDFDITVIKQSKPAGGLVVEGGRT